MLLVLVEQSVTPKYYLGGKNKMEGKVKFFNKGKGYGFVSGEDGKDYFVHLTGLEPGVDLNENDEITFTVEQGDKGPKAVKVSKK